MTSEVPMRLVLVDPPPGIDFGIQHGRGTGYETRFVQQGTRGDLVFDFSMKVTESRDGLPSFQGPFAQGPPASRFVYVDVGTYAGQKNAQWSRRMIVRLQGITWAQIEKATSKPGHRMSARIAGRGKDGSPRCATVPVIGGWQVIEG